MHTTFQGKLSSNPLKAKMLCNPRLAKLPQLGKLNTSISHCCEENDIISTWYFSLIFVLDVSWSSALPHWCFWHRILLARLFVLFFSPIRRRWQIFFIPSVYPFLLCQERCETVGSYLELDKYKYDSSCRKNRETAAEKPCHYCKPENL